LGFKCMETLRANINNLLGCPGQGPISDNQLQIRLSF
jgi:hypothetical protein